MKEQKNINKIIIELYTQGFKLKEIVKKTNNDENHVKYILYKVRKIK